MRTGWILLLFVSASLHAQNPVTPAQFPELQQIFDKQADEQSLACQVTPLRPNLSFAFRIQSGYYADISLKQLEGTGHRILVLMRVTPEGSEATPYYFLQGVDLPRIPERNKALIELSGGVYLGEGKYTVDWVALDQGTRACRKQWRVEAKLSNKEKQLKVVQEPGTVAPVVMPQWIPTTAAANDQPRTATIFLNVSPLRPRSLRLSVFDRALMFGTLKAVLEQSPFTSVKIVAFNLERHLEIFRQDHLDQAGFSRLRQAVLGVSLATVDMSVLKDRNGHLGLLSRLVSEELAKSAPSDAVIFIGPNTRRADKLPEDWPAAAGGAPRFFYLEYAPFIGPTFPDVITRAVRSFDGKWYQVHSPHDLATALQKMEREVSSAAVAEN